MIFVVIDRLSKYANFIPLANPFSAVQVAQAYLDYVFKLHGWPRSTMSDRDLALFGKFWKRLFTLQGTNLLHPHTDGKIEVSNRCLEMYLRCMCSKQSKGLCLWISFSKLWYNNHYQTVAQLMPYEIVYNYPPSIYFPYLLREGRK